MSDEKLPESWEGRTPTPDQWRQILELHARWLSGEPGGVRAILDGARLVGASLVGASLVGASLVGASLVGARLDRARLDGANLVGARLDRARLDRARLDGAILDRARLDGAILDRASLVGASLVGARLDGARLDRASLVGASLDGARLDGARLDGRQVIGACPIFQIGPIGSRLDTLTAYVTDQGPWITTGCFRGTLPEFLAAVAKTHGDSLHAREYQAAVRLIEAHILVVATTTSEAGK